jgi:hypothetical protein
MPATDPRPSTRGKARKNKRNATTLKRIESAKRTEGILQLRRRGLSLQKIGEAYKIDHSRVWQIITKALNDGVRENLEQLRNLELARLDDLQTTWYPKAKQGDPVALDKVRGLMADRAKLLGLYAPVKIENTDQVSVTRQEIEEGAAMFDERLRLRAAARRAQLEARLKTMEGEAVGEKPQEAAE